MILADCPYGAPGERLWVREAWKTGCKLDQFTSSEIKQRYLDAGWKEPVGAPLYYLADGHWTASGATMIARISGTGGRYRHPRFMPRWASRILLEITEVRVQRLRED